MLRRLLVVAAFLSCLSCGEDEPQAEKAATARQEPLPRPRIPPADPRPVEQAPPDDESARGAAEVLRTYYALIEAGRYPQASRLRWERRSGEEDVQALAASFAKYGEYHATVGTPGPISGDGGSHYVDVPVQLYGRLKSGAPFSTAGTITLRRAAGSPEGWRIYSRE